MELFGDTNTGRKPRLYIHRDCVHLIAQIKMAQHSEKTAGDVQKFDYIASDAETFADSEQEGDDMLDATRYGLFSNTDGGVIRYAQAVPICGFQPVMAYLGDGF